MDKEEMELITALHFLGPNNVYQHCEIAQVIHLLNNTMLKKFASSSFVLRSKADRKLNN